MMGLPVAVFLHNRFSRSPLPFLFFSPLWPSSSPLRRRLPSRGCGWPQQVLTARSSTAASSALPISPYVGNVHAPARAFSSRGGCILITFMSSDIPARFIAPAPADSAKTCEPTLSSIHSPYMLPFFLDFRALLSFFFSSLRSLSTSLGPRFSPFYVI